MEAQPVELGPGARAALSAAGAGRVRSVFPKAAYLDVPGGLVALTSLDAPPGPIHARATVVPGGLVTGDPVVVTASLLQAGPLLLDLGRPRIFRGVLPAADEMAAGAGLAIDLLEGAPPSSIGEPGVEYELRRWDIAGAAARLGGLGPGLTPAGDDCLAGILLVARIRWGDRAERALVAAADGVPTNDIARAFLRWAARGQSIEPVHRFLASAVRSEAGEAARALGDLLRFGHSSGADLALGLRLALGMLPGEPRPELAGRVA